MTNKLNFCYCAYNVFSDIFDADPNMSGCYQWIRAFNGKAMNLRDFYKDKKGLPKACRSDQRLLRKEIKARIEEFDVVMVNSDPADCRLMQELREILGHNSSTQLVLNQDHAPELWAGAYEFPQDFKEPIFAADKVFATSPTAQKCMQALVGFDSKTKIHLCPHPCETHVIKHMRSVFESDHLLVFWHRYGGGENFLPYIVASQCYDNVTLCGHMEGDDKHLRRTRCTFKQVIPALNYPSFVKLLVEAKFAFEPFQSYSFGRNTCDSAAVGLPVVGNRNIYSMQINYPMTCVDPYDATKIYALFDRLKKDPAFYSDVSQVASFNSNYFGHDMCRQRFMAMLESDKPSMVENVEKHAMRGEADAL